MKARMPKITAYFGRHRQLWLAGGLAALICGLYAALLAGRSLSPAEGWYSYYGYLINETGAVPYLDFELLFPPLYTYLIAGFTRLFGYEIMALRVFGVLIYTATGLFAALIFEKLTKNWYWGLLCGVISAAVLQSEVVQIFYDYIRVMDLCVYISVYFFLCYFDRFRVEGAEKLRPNKDIILGTVFAVLASMCKQSSGLFFLIFCFLFVLFLLICLGKSRRELLLQLGVMAAVTALLYGIMAIFLASKGAFGAYLHYNFSSSLDAKGGGSILSILFGWIPRSGKALLLAAVLTLVPVALAVGLFLLSRRYPDTDAPHPVLERVIKIAAPVLLVLAVVLPVLFVGYVELMAPLMGPSELYIRFFCALLVFAIACFAIIFRKKANITDWPRHLMYAFLSGVIFVLAFSVCTSGGLVESQIAMGYAFLSTVLLSLARHKKKELVVTALAAMMIFQSAVCFAKKTNNMYYWWGLSTGGAFAQTENCDVPIFAGIKMNAAYADMYDHVYAAVTEHTAPGEEIFVFPHMPVLYLATDRPRATETAIQWFDVSTDQAVINDIEILRTKKPKVLVLCSIDDSVIVSHESMFRGGEQCGLRKMQDFLYEFVREENYICFSSDRISEMNTVTVWILP